MTNLSPLTHLAKIFAKIVQRSGETQIKSGRTTILGDSFAARRLRQRVSNCTPYYNTISYQVLNEKTASHHSISTTAATTLEYDSNQGLLTFLKFSSPSLMSGVVANILCTDMLKNPSLSCRKRERDRFEKRNSLIFLLSSSSLLSMSTRRDVTAVALSC